jgi:hypothetical protein
MFIADLVAVAKLLDQELGRRTPGPSDAFAGRKLFSPEDSSIFRGWTRIAEVTPYRAAAAEREPLFDVIDIARPRSDRDDCCAV